MDSTLFGLMRRAAIGVKKMRDEVLFIPVDWLFPTHSKLFRRLALRAMRRVKIPTTRVTPVPTVGVLSGEDDEVDRSGRW